MKRVNIKDAEANLEEYVDALNLGEEDEIVINEFGRDIAIIKGVEKKSKKRLGAAVGKAEELPFDLKNEEMNEEIIKDFDLW